ncbi:VIT domain-containing protein [uncultured Tenacibaculum sp.]|uniref:VIT domain-containing protein n=1 Tax=uncultured Tenacibaculum sp. TaxID=174713 RepID=UPI00260D90E4|nr:VIT domain-containing protein [uncultured Tenacibaculum sp.]
MKKLLFINFLLISLGLYSQNTPKITLQNGEQLKLSSLKVKTEITGDYATTTYDMEFYNGLDRTLEGELSFPLGEGQSVYKFAMELNGNLREAVVVEKELARVAYETTIRQNIDPALLEKTKGNNYKARVYPILPKATKRVVLTYEEKLSSNKNKLVYNLPLGFKQTIDFISIDIFVYGISKSDKIKVVSELSKNPNFIRKGNVVNASIVQKNVKPQEPIKVIIASSFETEKTLTYRDYFYTSVKFKNQFRDKKKPEKICILWDASFSMRNKILTKELELLSKYFSYLKNVEVEFVSFNNAIVNKKKFNISEGNWDIVKKEILAQTYDGGTNLEILKTIPLDAKEVLLFSDGLTNLGSIKRLKSKTIYTINSLISADHFLLNTIATNLGGVYINLGKLDSNEAFKLLKREVLQFLGYQSTSSLEEVYPKNSVNIMNDFVISGRFKRKSTIKLIFGYQDEIIKEISIDLDRSKKSSQVKRLWAKEKLKYLSVDKEENKKAIISLAKQYQLITDYTSMLILDRIQDYVKYKIEPPKELRRQYKALLREREEDQISKREDFELRREDIFDQYKEVTDWYNETYPLKKVKNKRISQTSSTSNISRNQTVIASSNNTNTSNSNDNAVNNDSNADNSIEKTDNDSEENTLVSDIDYSKNVVRGIVKDSSGPLPGVNVWVKGTRRGTETDFDGKYTINVEKDEVLVFSFVGCVTEEAVVSNRNILDIELEEDNVLDEVVVVAYGSRQVRSYTGSVAIKSNEGLTSGVVVAQNSSENENTVVRGNNIYQEAIMYIVNGIPANKKVIEQLKPNEIASVQVIKPIDAVKLYGEKARNGIIIFTTKKGLITHKKEIERLNLLIEQRIELKAWNPEVPYLEVLEKETSVVSAYDRYLEIRDHYSNSPMFYIDVADFFDQRGAKEMAIRVLTNLIEIDLDNYELLKALAYKLEYFKEYDLAKYIYKRVLELRPEEPQSYRDLALAYELAGNYQDSFDLLYKIYNGDLIKKDEEERFDGIEAVVFVELTRLVSKYRSKLRLDKHQKKLFKSMPVDIRIVVDWNHNDTDLDLWVVDPKEEKASYKNIETEIGGRMSLDMTDGYGPEEFMLKKAIKGRYKVMIDYYADNLQKISGPPILKVTMFTNYGRKKEKRETIIVKLDKKEDYIEIGTLQF